MKKLRYLTCLILLIVGQLGFCATAPLLTSRPDVQAFINMMVKDYHFNPQALNQVFAQVQINPQIIATMTAPYEAKPWAIYQKLFVNEQRIEEGIKFWKEHDKLLAAIEKQYGVPAHIILAILGIETHYGQAKFKYRAIDSLATLAFDYPPRSKYFTKELREYLLLTREQQLDPLALPSSYAGALGMAQFMPSSYRAYSVNFNHPNKPNLFNSTADNIASVANYLKVNGWRPGEAITTPAKIKGTFSLGPTVIKPQYPLYELMQKGIYPSDKQPTNQLASVLTLANQDLEHWLVFNNFYVITRYNKSPLYAMAVYQLSQELAARYKQEK
jgi:membrane-bound lytic murein transglycosylase B